MEEKKSQSFRWQADIQPGRISFNAGASARQRGIASGQRGWKWQPLGGSSGDGISPLMGRNSECRVSRRGTSRNNA
jgi:hypothetical protein